MLQHRTIVWKKECDIELGNIYSNIYWNDLTILELTSFNPCCRHLPSYVHKIIMLGDCVMFVCAAQMFDLGILPSQKLKQAPHSDILCDH